MAKFSLVRDLKCLFSHFLQEGSRRPSKVTDWKLLGQEKDGSILVGWKEHEDLDGLPCRTCIGSYLSDSNSFEILSVLESDEDLVQATINSSKTIILYVKKIIYDDSTFYQLGLTPIISASFEDFSVTDERQTMVQFLHMRKSSNIHKFLVLIHQKSISLYQLETSDLKMGLTQTLRLELLETLVKTFSWAQWNTAHQSLFYIYYKTTASRDEREDEDNSNKQSSILTALQFNETTPHETVLNIPLNLPSPLLETTCNTYDNIPIPVKVHDCSLDVTVLADDRGVVCICHNYLYQPVKGPTTSDDMENSTVHIAFSVTLLHHGQVIHSTMPGIPWVLASTIKPIFALHRDDYIIVYMPGLFVQLLDMGPGHEPCCHIVNTHEIPSTEIWAQLKLPGSDTCFVDLKTLRMFNLDICSKILSLSYFDKNLGLSNKLSIIHYFLVHKSDFDTVTELLRSISDDCLNPDVTAIFHEVLVSGSFASVQKSLSLESVRFMRLLPLSTVNPMTTIDVKVKGRGMTLTSEALWNPAVMLLSPRQRLCQFRSDLWNKLWDLIADTTSVSRFKPMTVAEKLTVSLICYQPEALSRCSTPLSPGSGLVMNTTLSDMTNAGNYRVKPNLPFNEVEKCTASKQEHVTSVNLRELSIHLVKHGLENPLQVHIVATRYAAAQVEMSRYLCSVVTNSAGVTAHPVKGFQLVNDLQRPKRRILFMILERYFVAVETLAYPTPQGFSSFFTYLAFAILPFEKFVQYIQAHSLQLQIDVMKKILSELEDDKAGVEKKLRLLMLLPRSRARRLLNQWPHPVSLMLRGREHAVNILSGVESRTHSHKPINHNSTGLTTFHSAARYSPLDTFLDLLTAKASLAELDFNLLVEATISSVEND